MTGHDYSLAVSDALLCGTGLMLLALLMALAVLLRQRRRTQAAPVPRPEVAARVTPYECVSSGHTERVACTGSNPP
jgi:hypothetical protein